jgi:hypothetical protein
LVAEPWALCKLRLFAERGSEVFAWLIETSLKRAIFKDKLFSVKRTFKKVYPKPSRPREGYSGSTLG